MKERGGKSVSFRELAVVAVVLAVLAWFGVPWFRDVVERSRASEAFSFLATLQQAQARYRAREQRYAKQAGDLDTPAAPLKFFVDEARADVSASTRFVSMPDGWRLTVVRKAATSSYGEYTVTYTQSGFDRANSSIATNADLNARINPISD